MIVVTGGAGAGKTRLCQRLYGELPEEWRLVNLDNFIDIAFTYEGSDWLAGKLKLGEICLGYWRKERVNKVLVEGVIRSAGEVRRLARAFGLDWPSASVRVLQLQRSLETHRRRRLAPGAWDPPGGLPKEQAIANHETRVPPRIDGAGQIVTDPLDPGEVFLAAVQLLA